VVGKGYVGLVTGICITETGTKVICVNIDQAKVVNLVLVESLFMCQV